MKLIYQRAPVFPLTHINLIMPRTGACLDPPQRRGLSRLTLRLMLMGAGGLSNEVLSARLERLGATTSFALASDHTVLRLSVLTSQLHAALELFLLCVHQPNFDPAEFAQLQGELTSAWLADREESKQLRAHEVYLHEVYGNGPQGYLADGLAEGLRRIGLDDVKRQYQRLLAGGEPILAVLSDLPRAEVEARVSPRITLPPPDDGASQAGSAPGASYPWDGFAPPQAAGRQVTIVADENTKTDEVVLGAFSVAQTDADRHLHRLIALSFGGDMNSRLFRVVRGERGLSYGASCWYEAGTGRVPRNHAAPFTVYTFPSVEHTAEAVPLVISLYEELFDKGVTAEELELARASLINSHPFLRDTPQKLLAIEVEKALHGVATDDDATNRRKLVALAPEKLLHELRRSHHPEQLHIVLLGDPARLEPIAAGIAGVANIRTIRYPGEEAYTDPTG